jgi:uncharacterized protein
MVQLIIGAFLMGCVGSFHCVGMCGPLALALPIKDDGVGSKMFGALLYNSGRIVTYSVFGLLFGLIGRTVSIFGYQQWLSIVLGVGILLFLVLPKKITAVRGRSNWLMGFFEKLRQFLGGLFFKKNPGSLFAIGLLNGLLPCGLVYMAAAAAVATGDIVDSMIFMAFFGLGTLPMMWSIVYFGNYVSVGIRQKIRKAYPYMLSLMACLLILRGMGLGIPHLSPKWESEKRMVQSCPVK